jgi:hypothetical protein
MNNALNGAVGANTKGIPLRIEPAPNGGFMVGEGWGRESGMLSMPLFACTTIGEALEFIKGRLAPTEVKANPPELRCDCAACRPRRGGVGDWRCT